jgi:hypothetical protein
MRSWANILGLLAASFLVGMPAALSQPHKGRMGMSYYDRSTETTVVGTVQDIIQPQGGRGPYGMGTHLLVKTDSETVEVHLGPTGYISRQGFSFAKNDAVEILGSKTTVAGKAAIIARVVTKDGKKLTLRDETGRPTWAGPQ